MNTKKGNSEHWHDNRIKFDILFLRPKRRQTKWRSVSCENWRLLGNDEERRKFETHSATISTEVRDGTVQRGRLLLGIQNYNEASPADANEHQRKMPDETGIRALDDKILRTNYPNGTELNLQTTLHWWWWWNNWSRLEMKMISCACQRKNVSQCLPEEFQPKNTHTREKESEKLLKQQHTSFFHIQSRYSLSVWVHFQ